MFLYLPIILQCTVIQPEQLISKVLTNTKSLDLDLSYSSSAIPTAGHATLVNVLQSSLQKLFQDPNCLNIWDCFTSSCFELLPTERQFHCSHAVLT